jgi:hypothetical protein
LSWEAIVVIGLLVVVVLHLYSIESKLVRIIELMKEHFGLGDDDDE